MTIIGLVKTVENVFNHATAGVILAPHKLTQQVKYAIFDNRLISTALQGLNKAISPATHYNRYNLQETVHGYVGQLPDAVRIPRLAYQASEYLAKQVTPENQAFGAVIDNAAYAASIYIGPVAQWAGQALQTFL
jgi:hypothetical protein